MVTIVRFLAIDKAVADVIVDEDGGNGSGGYPTAVGNANHAH